jgi:hypothetical protein
VVASERLRSCRFDAVSELAVAGRWPVRGEIGEKIPVVGDPLVSPCLVLLNPQSGLLTLSGHHRVGSMGSMAGVVSKSVGEFGEVATNRHVSHLALKWRDSA